MQQSDVDRIKNATPILAQRVVFLNTIPLTRKRYEAEKPRNGGILSWLTSGRHKSDFLEQVSLYYEGWKEYEDSIALPILAEILEISSETKIVLDFDVDFQQFGKVLLSEEFDVVFLCAHHATEGIEFSDGIVDLEKVKHAIEAVKHKKPPLSLIFFVCQASPLAKPNLENSANIGAVATAFWNMPVIESYQFIKHWLLRMEPCNTLTSAYSSAIKDMLKS